jgi:hypothetical protein
MVVVVVIVVAVYLEFVLFYSCILVLARCCVSIHLICELGLQTFDLCVFFVDSR